MSTHDMNIANSSGAAVRADVNLALVALASTSKDSSRPGTVFDGQLQIYTATTPWTLDIYDGADYIPLLHVDATNNIAYPYSSIGNADAILISNNTSDADHDVDFSAGAVLMSSNLLCKSAGVITKRLDAAWAAGSGNGGLDTGSIAANTTYHCYVIRKTSDGTLDGILSTGTSGPTVMPSGYAGYSRRGSVVTDASSNVLPFAQRGREFRFSTPITDVDLTTSPSSKTAYSMSVPNGIITLGRFSSIVYNPAGVVATSIYPYYGCTASTPISWSDAYKAAYTPFSAFTSAAKQIEMIASGAVVCTQWDVQTLGWCDYQLELGG